MATGIRFVLPYETVVDPNGVPLGGAQLFFYATGTSTPSPVYSDAALTLPISQPVLAGAAGANGAGRFPAIFLSPVVTYKVVLEDAQGNLIWTADPVIAPGASGSTTTALVLGTAGAPTGEANAIILYTDDGETLKYKDGGNTAFSVQTQPVVNNVGSFTAANITVDAGGRVTTAASGVSGGALSAEFSYSVSSGTGPDLASSSANAWNKRSLNTTVINNIPGCSLATNSVTLPAGTYFVSYSMGVSNPSAGYSSGGRLRNTTDSVSLAVSSLVSMGTAAGNTVAIEQCTTFTIAGSKVFELDMWATNTTAKGGAAITSGENEVYVRLTIVKIA